MKPKIQLCIPEHEYKEIASEGWTRPNGIGTVGTYLKQNSFDVELLSGVSGMAHNEMLDHVCADIVGISTTIGNYRNALELAKKAKKVNPDCSVVFGGPEATMLHKEILTNRGEDSNDYCVDAVVRGDGAEAFYQFISGKEQEMIPNLAYIKDGKIVSNPVVREDKINWPVIDNSLFDMEKIITKYGNKFNKVTPFKRATSIMSQYGCNAYHCRFCGRTDRQWFGREPEHVWQEIRELIEKYGVELIFDFSDSFIQNPLYIKKIFEKKPSDLNPAFRFFARADQLNQQNVELMKKLGAYEIYIGFESGDQRMLDGMSKQTTIEQNLASAKLLGDYNLKILGAFVLGAPGETSSSLENTVRHAKEIQEISGGRLESCLCSIWLPLPGSWSFSQIRDKFADRDILDLEELKREWVSRKCNVSYDALDAYVDKVLEASGALIKDIKGNKK